LEKKINSSDLSLLIPSKGRPKELLGLLRYFARREIKYKIIILESGNSYKEVIKANADLDIEHHIFDPDISIDHKLLRGAQLIDTPLVCICADDDFILSNSMEDCAQFLINHPEYSACQGYHARFEQREYDFYLLDFLWFTPSLESCNPLIRIHDLITRYQPICWSVIRTGVFLKMSKEYPDMKSLLFFELFWSSSAAVEGKVKRIPSLYCLRKLDPIQPFGHPLFLFAESPEGFFEDYRIYREWLEKALYKDQHSLTERRRILDLIHACLFHSETDRGTLRYIIQKAIEDPKVSILIPDTYASIKIPVPIFPIEESRTIQRGKINYHFAAKFLNPEPADEIKLQSNFHLKLLDDLEWMIS